MAIWMPVLSGRRGPKYLQIVEALAEDIASGTLRPGMRLPAHRELAYRLNVSANTTNRAYSEGVARALLQGEVGRGTFVRERGSPPPYAGPADLHRPSEGPIDLSRNLPSPGGAAVHLARTLTEMKSAKALRSLLDYETEADRRDHGKVAVEWLRHVGIRMNQDEAIITSGAQHGILTTLMAITRPGDLLLTEELTYAPIRAIADRLGLKIQGIPMDEHGPCPDHLGRICRDRAVKAFYFTSTFQTPTSITMPEDRRKAIAEIARHHDFLLIEDDVFGSLEPDPVLPVATIAPERTIYVGSASKCLSPGLRVGFLRAPTQIAAGIRGEVSLSCWMTPPLMTEIVARWISDGTADRLTAMQRDAAARRQDIARTIFDGLDFRAGAHALHLWLTLPLNWSADAFRAEAARRNVLVTEGAAFAVAAGVVPRAVRLCLSHEADEARLRHGLSVLRNILTDPPMNAALIL